MEVSEAVWMNHVKGAGKSCWCVGGQETGKPRSGMASDLIRVEDRHGEEEDTEPCAGLKACALLLLLSWNS